MQVTTNTATVEAWEEHDVGANQAFGFWLYLMSDLVLFAALFATYAVLAQNYAGGPTGKELFDLRTAFIETMLLLLSSTAFGLVMINMHQGKRDRVMLWMVITFLLGGSFLALEIHEFATLIGEGHGPARSGFLSAFFTLVGTHGIHVSAGLIWMAIMFVQVLSKGFTLPVQSRLMHLSMFWHFLDIVWVAVFTIVYLLSFV